MIDKQKFLVPNDLTIAQFLFVIRKRLQMKASEALFLYVNGRCLSGGQLICTIHANHKSEDGFLYLVYALENTFG